MTQISAAAVKALRDKTQLPMMECKRALQEAGGDQEAAIRLLRERGRKTMAKRVGRATNAGRIAVYASIDEGRGTMIELQCESSPVASHEEFRELASDLALQLATGPGAETAEDLWSQPSPSHAGMTLEQQRDDIANRIREVFRLERIVRIDAPCGGYVHHTGTDGVLVEVKGGTAEAAKDICMHIAAMRPKVINKGDVDPAEVDKEREILATQARTEGKPEKIIEKMVEGRLRNFFAERVLCEQPFVKDEQTTVGKFAQAHAITPVRFIHWQLGRPEYRPRFHSNRLNACTSHVAMPDATPQDTVTRDSHVAFRRLVLKLSGESFADRHERGISMHHVVNMAGQIYSAAGCGAQVAVVIGGGNILRGTQFTSGQSTIQEGTAHYMGMLATVINGLALQDALESLGCHTRLMSAIRMDGVAEPYIRRRAKRHLEKGRIVILAGGTGSPFVTTDTAAAQRALELDAEILLKATRVDGVFSEDPEKNPHAILFRHLTYQTVLEKDLGFMDRTAITQCMEHALPILVFNYNKQDHIQRAVEGQRVGTLINRDPPAEN